MATSSKTNIEKLQAENAFLRRGGIAEEVGKTVRFLVIGVVVVTVAYFFSHSVEVLAGKETNANILVNLLGKLEISMVLSWVVGGAGVVYGRAQKKLRKSTTDRLTSRVRDLENQVDPNRTSSRLTASGDTNPEDR